MYRYASSIATFLLVPALAAGPAFPRPAPLARPVCSPDFVGSHFASEAFAAASAETVAPFSSAEEVVDRAASRQVRPPEPVSEPGAVDQSEVIVGHHPFKVTVLSYLTNELTYQKLERSESLPFHQS